GIALEADIRREAEPLHDPRPEPLDQRVRLIDQAQHRVLPGLVLEVDGDVAAAAQQQIEARVVAVAVGGGADIGGAIDAHDFGAHIGEQHRAKRRRTDAGQLDDLDPCERSHIPSFPVALLHSTASRATALSSPRLGPMGPRNARVTMDSTALRELQAPLKDKYRNDPDAAVVTLKAQAELSDGAIACKVETGRALVEAGLHPATGGSGLEACSGDMLLEALVACAGVTLKAVATAIDSKLKGGTVRAEGDLDFRGTLGIDRT